MKLKKARLYMIYYLELKHHFIELVIAQLLYLNYQNDQTITMYINSPGTNSPDGRAFSFDTEAFAIADTMQFIRYY